MTLRTKDINNLLSDINKHSFDGRIKFKEEGHLYWIDGNNKDLVSVTTYIHRFFEHFDTKTVIENILRSKKYKDIDYKYYKMSFDDIKNQWDENARTASEAGTKLHADIEHFYNGFKIENDSDEYKQFIEFYKDNNFLKIYRTEWMIFSDMLKITGSIDAVFKNEDGTLSLGDWKRSKEINYNSYGNKVGKFPFDNLPDCNFYHYSLQLNLYKIILEKFYGFTVKEMFLVICHPNNINGKYQKLYVDNMEDEANLLLSIRKDELIKLGYPESRFEKLDIKLLTINKNENKNKNYNLNYTMEYHSETEDIIPHKTRLLKSNTVPDTLINIETDSLINKGKRWTEEENEKLMTSARNGTNIKDLVSVHQRTENSLKMRIIQNILKISEKEKIDINIVRDRYSQITLEQVMKFKQKESEKLLEKVEKEVKKLPEPILVKKFNENNLSEKQKYCYELMVKGENLFITGPAGCGKTTVIKSFYSNYNKYKNIGITSTTGVSAVLLGGSTLHSFLGIGLGNDTAESLFLKIRNNSKIFKRWLELNTLILDEVSMLKSDLFDKLELIARKIRNNDKPFGGIQLIITGDFLQLQPVNSVKFCFEADSWNNCIKNVVYLNDIFRQNDEIFQTCLNEMRIGKLSNNTINILKSRVNIKLNNDIGILPTKIYSLNKDVDAENEKELNKLFMKNENLEFYEYELDYILLKNNVKYIDELLKKSCNAPLNIKLCIGAQVMLLINLDIECNLANGSRGVIVRFQDDFPVVKFLTGEERIIEYTNQIIEDNGVKILNITYIPLKVAYSVTIHKCQGSTIDLAIVDMNGIFEDAQGYTAVSRVKTLEGLSLKNFNVKKITANQKAVKYYNDII
jgi:ATP-dependent DNA helicase PIF1